MHNSIDSEVDDDEVVRNKTYIPLVDEAIEDSDRLKAELSDMFKDLDDI